MKYKDIKSLDSKELKTKIQSLDKELFAARMKNPLGQLANPLQIRFLRRDIARMKMAASQVGNK